MSLIKNTLDKNALGQIENTSLYLPPNGSFIYHVIRNMGRLNMLKDFPRVMGIATRKLTSELDLFLIVLPYLSLSLP